MRIYTPNDINVISRVQAAALNTALPVILAILKHAHDHETRKEIVEFDQIIADVKEDSDLEKANYEIPDDSLIKNSAKELIAKKLLEEKGGKITMTKSGREAVELLLLHLKTDDEKDDS